MHVLLVFNTNIQMNIHEEWSFDLWLLSSSLSLEFNEFRLHRNFEQNQSLSVNLLFEIVRNELKF